MVPYKLMVDVDESNEDAGFNGGQVEGMIGDGTSNVRDVSTQ